MCCIDRLKSQGIPDTRHSEYPGMRAAAFGQKQTLSCYPRVPITPPCYRNRHLAHPLFPNFFITDKISHEATYVDSAGLARVEDCASNWRGVHGKFRRLSFIARGSFIPQLRPNLVFRSRQAKVDELCSLYRQSHAQDSFTHQSLLELRFRNIQHFDADTRRCPSHQD